MWVFRLLVFAQFAIVLMLLYVTGTLQLGWVAWSVLAASVGLGLWAVFTMGKHFNVSPRLGKDAPLRTSGPYRFVRHPMYLALLIFCGTFLVERFSLYGVFLWLALLLVLACKVHYEERELRKRFSGSQPGLFTTTGVDSTSGQQQQGKR